MTPSAADEPRPRGGPRPGEERSRSGLVRRFLAPLVIAALLAAQGAFLYLYRHPQLPALPAPVTGEEHTALLASVTGSVFITSGAGQRDARTGDGLQHGDRLITGTDGHAEIELHEVGVLIVDAGSQLERTIETDHRPGFFLHAGRMLVQVTAATETELPILQTPHATFLARPGEASEFLVLAEP